MWETAKRKTDKKRIKLAFCAGEKELPALFFQIVRIRVFKVMQNWIILLTGRVSFGN